MPWIKCYSLRYDMMYQCEVSEETAAKAREQEPPIETSNDKFPGVEVRPENLSEWPEMKGYADAVD